MKKVMIACWEKNILIDAVEQEKAPWEDRNTLNVVDWHRSPATKKRGGRRMAHGRLPILLLKPDWSPAGSRKDDRLCGAQGWKKKKKRGLLDFERGVIATKEIVKEDGIQSSSFDREGSKMALGNTRGNITMETGGSSSIDVSHLESQILLRLWAQEDRLLLSVYT